MKFNFTTLKPCKSFVMRRFAASPRPFDDVFIRTWTVFESCSVWWKSFFKRERFSCLLEWLALLKEQHLYHVWWITISLSLSICLTQPQALPLHFSHSPIRSFSLSRSHSSTYILSPSFSIISPSLRESLCGVSTLPHSVTPIWLTWVLLSSSFDTLSRLLWDTR